MPSSFSTSLRLELQASGENRNVWGTKNNTNLSLLEASISGFESIDMSDSNVTLSTANGSSDEARKAIIYLTGTNTATRSVTIPTVSKAYYIINATSGDQDVTVTNGSSSVSLANGEISIIYTDGTTVWKVPYISYGPQSLTTSEKAQILTNIDISLVGSVSFFAMNTAPNGWLECDGSAVSRTTYAALFAAIGTTWGTGDGSTTFNVPDLRGEFVRVWDNGKGTDSGRAFASSQSSANLAHTHTANTNTTGAHTHSVSGTAASSGSHSHTIQRSPPSAGSTIAAGSDGSAAGTISTSTNGAHTHSVSGTASSNGNHSHTVTVDSSGGTEARPRNVALMACVKT